MRNKRALEIRITIKITLRHKQNRAHMTKKRMLETPTETLCIRRIPYLFDITCMETNISAQCLPENLCKKIHYIDNESTLVHNPGRV